MIELLKKLSEAHGPTGYEDSVGQIMKTEMKKYSDKVEVDRMGNVIAKKGSGSPVYMIAAHMDEIGFIVKYIDEKGYIWFITMGGFFEPTIYHARVVVHSDRGPVFGVIGGKPIHLMEEEERKKPLQFKKLFIDVGCSNKKEVESLGIHAGTPVTFSRSCVQIKDYITGKALDNRVGCCVMIEILKKLKKFKGTIYCVATVQEELGLKGAGVSAFRIKPDFAIAIDVSLGGQAGVEEKDADLVCGKGPAVAYIEAGGRGLVADPQMNKWMIAAAKKNKIPYQIDVGWAGMTDAAIISTTGEGIPTTSIGVPTKYIHSPVEMVHKKDLENTVKLIVAALESGPPKTLFSAV